MSLIQFCSQRMWLQEVLILTKQLTGLCRSSFAQEKIEEAFFIHYLNGLICLLLQVDCPEDVASYIHRVGRTARYLSGGRSVLFLMPSEMKMLEKLQAAKIPIQFIKVD